GTHEGEGDDDTGTVVVPPPSTRTRIVEYVLGTATILDNEFIAAPHLPKLLQLVSRQGRPSYPERRKKRKGGYSWMYSKGMKQSEGEGRGRKNKEAKKKGGKDDGHQCDND
ncbi:hypothetical protein FRC18_002047, partial [Serendipita sp. 400]